MTKERLILAFFAIVAGLFVASSLFYFYGQRTNTVSTDNPSPTSTQQAANTSTALSIDSPENESVTTDKSTTIKGKAAAGATIAISTDTQDYVTKAASDGSFSQKVDLGQNVNTITVSSLPDSGISETKTLTITSTQEEF